MPDLDWLENQPLLLLLHLAQAPVHWLQRFDAGGDGVLRWGLVAGRLAAFRRDLPLAHVDPLAVLERPVVEQAPAETPPERAGGSPGAWPARDVDAARGAGAGGPQTRLPLVASTHRRTSWQGFAPGSERRADAASAPSRLEAAPAASGPLPPPGASRATRAPGAPNGERSLPPVAPRLPTARLAALAGGIRGGVAAWEHSAGPVGSLRQGVQRPAPGGVGPEAARERLPVLVERHPPLGGRVTLLGPAAQTRALATPVGGPGLAPELLAHALRTGSVGAQRGAADDVRGAAQHGRGPAQAGERGALQHRRGPAQAGERGGPGGGAEQFRRDVAGADLRRRPVPSAGQPTAQVLPSMALLQTILARYEAGGALLPARQRPQRNDWPAGREAGRPAAADAGSLPPTSENGQTGAPEAGAHSPELVPATAAHSPPPGVAAGPVVQNTFNVTVHSGQSADEPDDELAERITRILVEQARRHGIDV